MTTSTGDPMTKDFATALEEAQRQHFLRLFLESPLYLGGEPPPPLPWRERWKIRVRLNWARWVANPLHRLAQKIGADCDDGWC